ncbi:Bacterial regulatory proteins, tetR family [Marinomonas spartinae]|uniref:Bacterial regulatory proteins, tetR family n=1 Tax=Marinomonas spartinae TaxID=1792290 RepID=A0A1A8TTC9_9GAMM|nr:TetR/AcrR family transcriptional regulator [Marinomonas spartinae]SBS29515.1 Bacterial regulatory proteins, tetR family [Marinomonas spartinae]SBS36995.1 Bacterial regulatory proteins, tetR family [Marinomonas spartinae]
MSKNLKFETTLAQSASCVRKPQQGRSVASLNRMFDAAMGLLQERGSDDFTLQEVSVIGKVSIGSIYYRFKNKDELVRELLFQGMHKMAEKEQDAINSLLEECTNLADYMPRYVKAYSDILKDHALLMRLAMRRAGMDPQASSSGNEKMRKAMKISVDAVLNFQDEITGNAALKASMVFQIIFASLARHLSLDTEDDSTLKQDWNELIEELSAMTLSYLENDIRY